MIESIIDEMGFELVGVESLSERGRSVLRLYIDIDGGVTIDDCARVSREIDDLINVKGIIEHKYILEVSSPGLNRPLYKENDFINSIGKKIKIRMLAPVNGRRNFSGVLGDIQEGILYIKLEKELVALPLHDVDKANLVYEF